jgi:hypothetical protein
MLKFKLIDNQAGGLGNVTGCNLTIQPKKTELNGIAFLLMPINLEY